MKTPVFPKYLSSRTGSFLLPLISLVLLLGAQTLSAQAFEWTFSPTGQWGEGTANPTINVDASGTFDTDPADVSMFLQGNWNSSLGQTITFNLTTPSYGVVGLNITQVADAGTMTYQVKDGDTVIGTKTFNGPTSWEVGIPAGTHEITIEGIGDDWISISSYYFKDSPAPAAGEVKNLAWTTDTVPVYGKAEASFDITNYYSNPFDPEVADVMVEIWGPNQEHYEIPAFWYVPYTISSNSFSPNDDGHWMLRFAPESEGQWTISITITDQYGSSTSNTYNVNAIDEGRKGFIHCDPNDRQGYRFSDGSPYIPVGMNLCWNDSTIPLNNYFETYLQNMGDNGMNWSRYWLVGFARQALEWGSDHWSGVYGGLGQYSQGPAQLLDNIMDSHQSNGVYTQLVLEQHGKVSEEVDPTWNENPYNAANGGPATTPSQYFSGTESRELIKKKYRYLVARYAYSPHIFTWELFNEVHWVKRDGVSTSTVEAWHREMAAYIKSIDPYQHIIATSADSEYLEEMSDTPNLDLLQDHIYTADLTDGIADLDNELLNNYWKPVLVGEYGANPNNDAYSDHKDELGDHLRQANWIGSMKRVPNMFWFWKEYIYPKDLFHIYKPLADYWNEEDPGAQANLTSITPTVEASAGTEATDYNSYGLQSDEAAYIYIRDTRIGDWSDTAETLSGQSLVLSGLPAGNWRVSYTFPAAETTELGSIITTDGTSDLRIALPNYTRDIAVKIKATNETYDLWQARFFTQSEIDSGLADPLASAGFDDSANLLKFAFGSDDPSAPLISPTLPNFDRDGETIALKINTAGANLIYIVESSSDLITWTEVTRYQNTPANAVQNLDLGSLLTGSKRAFVRIRVVTIDN